MAESAYGLSGRHVTLTFKDNTGTPLTYTAAALLVDGIEHVFRLARDRAMVMYQTSAGAAFLGPVDGGLTADAKLKLRLFYKSDNLTNAADRTTKNTADSLHGAALVGGWSAGVSTNPNPHAAVPALDVQLTFNDQGSGATDYTYTVSVTAIEPPTETQQDQLMVLDITLTLLEAIAFA